MTLTSELTLPRFIRIVVFWGTLGLFALGQLRAETGAIEALDTCEAIRAAFREFRRDSFPDGKWTCEDGVLRSVPGQKTDLLTREEFEDFELELEWKTAVGANSGIMYGVDETASETFWSGPEMQINDDPNHPDGLQPKTSSGGLYDLIAPSRLDTLRPTGEYNRVRIVSIGGHIEHWQNDVKVVEYTWGSASVRAQMKGTKFAAAPLFMHKRRGHIALQSEGDEVWFRAIRIRRLAPGATPLPSADPASRPEDGRASTTPVSCP